MAENKSTKRTKQLLAATLKKLLAEQPLDKIKINTLTEACGLNRQTFYYHFGDIYELVEFMYEDETDLYMGDRNGSLDWEGALLSLLTYFNENREICLNVIHSKASRYFENYLFRNIFRWEIRLVEEAAEGLAVDESYKRFLARYDALAVCGLASYWLQKAPAHLQKPEELIALVALTTEGTKRLALERYLQRQKKRV